MLEITWLMKTAIKTVRLPCVERSFMMKYGSVVVFMFMLVLLIACNDTKENPELITIEDIVFGNVSDERFDLLENEILAIEDDILKIELGNIDSIFHITSSFEGNVLTGSRIMVSIDLTTGEQVATKPLSDLGSLANIWDLGDGYFAIRAIDFENWDLETRENRVVLLIGAFYVKAFFVFEVSYEEI